MASNRHATAFTNLNVFICIFVSLLLPTAYEGALKGDGDTSDFVNDGGGLRLTREYHLRQGALRGFIVKPCSNCRIYNLQNVEIFLGIPYAAPPIGSLRFMPPVTAPPWPGVKMATRFAPVCPQSLPPIKKGDPPSLGRQHYMNNLKAFLKNESEDCLFLNIYVPYREQKPKKFPVLVFIHGDSFEWSSGNPYDGRIMASYGNIMVITVNYRLGILGFIKPSLTEHDYGNNGLLDQLAALKWIKDNIEDLNGDPHSVTLMGHGTGAACVNFLMLSPISNGLFHRAILMSGSALSDWAMTKNPASYTMQVAQSLGCNPRSKNLMTCLQDQPLSEIKKVQILAREFETPLGPIVAGSFIPNEPENTMKSFPNLLSKYQLLSGVTEWESYHDFGAIELDHGILENQRDDFITKYTKILFDGAENIALTDVLKQYATSRLDPQRWNVETNREVILNLFSDARTLSPMLKFMNYQANANSHSYFYVFGYNSISSDFASLNKSVHGEDLPYVLGVPLGGSNTHYHGEYTQREKLLSEVIMRLWTNFVKNGSPNTQSVHEYYTLNHKEWNQYNIEWPEYNRDHQSYLKLDTPPFISSFYRSNYTNFWTETLPNKLNRFVVDPMFEYTPFTSTQKPKTTRTHSDPIRRISEVIESPHHGLSGYGKLRPYSPPVNKPDTDMIYREIQAIKTPSRPMPPGLMEKAAAYTTTTIKPKNTASINMPVKTSSATITLVVSLGILFVAINIIICILLYYYRRKKLHNRQRPDAGRRSRAEKGEVDLIGQKDEKGALQTFKNGCSVIKSMSFNRIRNSSQKSNKKDKLEPVKTPKSDDSGGFRERFQLRRHLSTSTLDAHTKVRDWIANEVMHRCSPSILRKSNSDLNNDRPVNVAKPYTRSEELLSDPKILNKNVIKVKEIINPNKKFSGDRKRNSEKTTSTSALGSHSSIGSHKYSSANSKTKGKSNDSLKSKGTDSTRSKKVSVAIDATPAARSNSVLNQEPIELSKSFDISENRKTNCETKLQRSRTEGDFETTKPNTKKNNEDKIFTNTVTLSVGQKSLLKISHKHSISDPVTDINYEELLKKKLENESQIPPPVSFRNDINVTSKDENILIQPLTAAEALLTIKKRNFPKVLPDLPKSQKRLSLQPTTMQTFRSYSSSTESQSERPKVPPQPPPRTTTLDRRLAYKNTKLLSSFEVPNIQTNTETNISTANYENIDSLAPHIYADKVINKSFERKSDVDERKEAPAIICNKDRYYPRVIIASSDIPTSSETKIVIKPSQSQTDMPSNTPRVRLPDDFHSNTTGSITSFSSLCSDEDIEDIEDDFPDDIDEDKLIQQLVGGIDVPTNLDQILDSKGPETVFEKNLEIIPVKINLGHNMAPKNTEKYVCISNLLLPDVSDLQRTAQIKPNLGLNKLQHRSDSIQHPLEKTIKLKQKKTVKPTNLLHRQRSTKTSNDKSKSDSSNLEHSHSGSSNDTETSTGTVRKVDVINK